MTVRKPAFGEPELAARIRREAESYLSAAGEIEAQRAERMRRLDQYAAEAEMAQEQAEVPAAPPPVKKSRKQRSKHHKPTD